MLRELRGEFAAGTLYLVLLLGIVVLEVIGLLELHFEEDAAEANITTAGDASGGGTSRRRRSATATSSR